MLRDVEDAEELLDYEVPGMLAEYGIIDTELQKIHDSDTASNQTSQERGLRIFRMREKRGDILQPMLARRFKDQVIDYYINLERR